MIMNKDKDDYLNKKRKPNLFEKREEWNKLKGTSINYPALIVSGIVAFVIGLIRYWDRLFG